MFITAQQTIQENRWNKQDGILLTKNVIAPSPHLRMLEDEARRELMQQMDLGAYKALKETVLAKVIIFNKRRKGENSRDLQESKHKCHKGHYETLSPLEKELRKLINLEIRQV